MNSDGCGACVGEANSDAAATATPFVERHSVPAVLEQLRAEIVRLRDENAQLKTQLQLWQPWHLGDAVATDKHTHLGLLEVTSPLTEHKPCTKKRQRRRKRSNEGHNQLKPGSLEGANTLEESLVDDVIGSTFCPCCRRPLDVRWRMEALDSNRGHKQNVHLAQGSPSQRIDAKPAALLGRPDKYAYVSLLFGGSPSSTGYALGALALGQSLAASGTPYDKVLMHTNDVPLALLEMLQQSGLWKLRPVEYLHGCGALGNMRCWKGVFTKLRLFLLTEYQRVLFLDLDMLATRAPDELFELCPPAAMLKGWQQPAHGSEIDGREFFPTEQWNEPHGGINAGVMLLEPDERIHALMEREVLDEWHPEHIYSYGPEQEYVSRFFADRWTHISSRYNFQLFRFDAVRALRKLSLAPGIHTSSSPDSSRCSAGGETAVEGKVIAGHAHEEAIIMAQFSSYPKPWEFIGLSKVEISGKCWASAQRESEENLEEDSCVPLSLLHRWLDVFSTALARLPEEMQRVALECRAGDLSHKHTEVVVGKESGKG